MTVPFFCPGNSGVQDSSKHWSTANMHSAQCQVYRHCFSIRLLFKMTRIAHCFLCGSHNFFGWEKHCVNKLQNESISVTTWINLWLSTKKRLGFSIYCAKKPLFFILFSCKIDVEQKHPEASAAISHGGRVCVYFCLRARHPFRSKIILIFLNV